MIISALFIVFSIGYANFLSFICSLFPYYGLSLYSALWSAEPCKYVQHQIAYRAMLNCILLPVDGFIQTFFFFWKCCLRGIALSRIFRNGRKFSDAYSVSLIIQRRKKISMLELLLVSPEDTQQEMKTEIRSPGSLSSAL